MQDNRKKRGKVYCWVMEEDEGCAVAKGKRKIPAPTGNTGKL